MSWRAAPIIRVVSCAKLAHVVAAHSPMIGNPATHDGGGGGPALINSCTYSLTRSALSAMVMPTMTNGATTVTAINRTISVDASPARPLSRVRARK